MASSIHSHNGKPHSVTSIVRNNGTVDSSNRELVSDKASFIASLNNTLANNNSNGNGHHHHTSSNNTNTTNNSNHVYQNISQNASISSLHSTNGNKSNPPANTNGNGHTHAISHHQNNSHHNGNGIANGNSKANLNSNGVSNCSSNGNGIIPTATTNGIVATKAKNLDSYVGFANLPNQVYRKSV